MPTLEQAIQVAKAWHSVTDEWIVRRNKMHDKRQWEVVHDWGGDIVSDDTQRVVGRFSTNGPAEKHARKLEDIARATAVLRALSTVSVSR
jgi:H2-forming N5,N10-methylenetetrahydromethanopterin dehydrogenase-like enzyme